MIIRITPAADASSRNPRVDQAAGASALILTGEGKAFYSEPDPGEKPFDEGSMSDKTRGSTRAD